MDNLKVKVNDFPELEMAAETFAMFGDLSRLRILYILYETGQCCVYHLAEMMGMGVSAVSHHLRKLRDRKLVKKQRDGLNIYYSIATGEEAAGA
ncbi:MAG: metalloregulator ArsR/SmtB family transcription factor, partial [Candidatus Neomarinimicrobiota bacterium]